MEIKSITIKAEERCKSYNPEWAFNTKKKDEFIKNAGLEKWEELLEKVNGIVSKMAEKPDFYACPLPRQFVYFDTKTDEEIHCFVFDSNTPRCEEFEILLVDIGTYSIDEIMDSYNETKDRAYWTDWGIVLNMFGLVVD